jgi:N-acetylneuraminate synthase
MPAPEIEIAGRKVGADHEPFVICELSGNHNGDLDRALAMIDAAAATGCDAIKIQTYTADTITIESDRPEFRIEGGLWDGRTLTTSTRRPRRPTSGIRRCSSGRARRAWILFSTPFDETAVDLLAGLDAPAFKIASFEAVDLPLIRYAASKGRPLIISTGMASWTRWPPPGTRRSAPGAPGVALLHCVSSYPAPMEDANVRTVPDMAARFGCPIGLSDHTPGSAASVAAVALGACIIEKHFTLARADGGPTPIQPGAGGVHGLVRDCKAAWRALGRRSTTFWARSAAICSSAARST